MKAIESTATSSKRPNSNGFPLPVKRILVPTDFSECSLYALRYANNLARETGANLTLLHVVDSLIAPSDLEYVYVDPKALRAAVEKRASERLTELTRKEIDATEPASPIVRRGRAWEEIIETAKNRKIDLIVIGTHGYSGLKRAVLGSTAERVVRHAGCPVLVVRDIRTS